MSGRLDETTGRALIAELDREIRERRQMRARVVAALAAPGDLIPLSEARHRMRLTEDAALRRAQRGHGIKVKGRWYFERSYVDVNTR